ncbi:MAG TPA: zinc-ribbon domain-containing protein [Acidimicrobiales bacterium]|nr:zinc-ribbon domain-containing protein [Acidimicrobiales bacterium]
MTQFDEGTTTGGTTGDPDATEDTRKQSVNRYCTSCGNPLTEEAAFCPHCGSATELSGRPWRPQYPAAPRSTRSKTAAILLAVFLSFWTWLYTFRWNATKFWIGLGVSVGSWLLASIVGAETYTVSYYDVYGYYHPGNGAGIPLIVLGVLASIGIWVWAIVDTAMTREADFSNYPDRGF